MIKKKRTMIMKEIKSLHERMHDQKKAWLKRRADKGDEIKLQEAIQSMLDDAAFCLVFNLSDYNDPKYRGNKQKLADMIKSEVERYKEVVSIVSEYDPTGKYSRQVLQYIKRSGF